MSYKDQNVINSSSFLEYVLYIIIEGKNIRKKNELLIWDARVNGGFLKLYPHYKLFNHYNARPQVLIYLFNKNHILYG